MSSADFCGPVFERVTYLVSEHGTRTKTTLLENPKETGAGTRFHFLSGQVADREGNTALPGPKNATIKRTHIISFDLVKKRVRVRMHKHYGELMPIEGADS